MLKTKKNNQLKEIHELYRKNSGGTLDYIGEAYQYINGELKHVFSAGYNQSVSGVSPLTLTNSRAKNTNWKIDGQSSQDGTPTPTNPVDVKGVGNSGLPSTNCVVPVMVNREVPVEYKQLEYITAQSAGPYIQLTNGFDATDEIEIKTQIKNTAQDKYLVSPTTWNTSNNRFAMGGTLDYMRNVGFGNSGTSLTKYSPNILSAVGQITTETYSNKLFTITGDNINSTCNCSSITYGSATDNLKLFYGYNATTAGTIYYWKHKKVVNGVLTLVENLIPAQRISDSVVGMYDTVSKTFFTNQGTGTFTPGPEVGTAYTINLPAPLQKIGTYKDSIESDGTLTRGVGVKVFDGTENWSDASSGTTHIYYFPTADRKISSDAKFGLCSHFGYSTGTSSTCPDLNYFYYGSQNNGFRYDAITSLADWQAYLAAQYAAGTPVTIYYPLATETETTIEVPTISTNKGDNTIAIETEVAPSNTEFTYRKKTK